MQRVLTALILCLAILLGIAGNASAAFTQPRLENRVGGFGDPFGDYSGFDGLQALEPHQEITILCYDPATDVWFYVNQNPWTKFDPLGLYAEYEIDPEKSSEVTTYVNVTVPIAFKNGTDRPVSPDETARITGMISDYYSRTEWNSDKSHRYKINVNVEVIDPKQVHREEDDYYLTDSQLADKYRFNMLTLKDDGSGQMSEQGLANWGEANINRETSILHEVGHFMGMVDHYQSGGRTRPDGSFPPRPGFEDGFDENLFGGPNGTKIDYRHVTDMMDKLRSGFTDSRTAPSGRTQKSNVKPPPGGYAPAPVDRERGDKIAPFSQRKKAMEKRFIPGK